MAGQIDPAPVPQLIHANEGIATTSQGYLVRWCSHADHNTAWDYLHVELEMNNYIKLYTSQHFTMQPNMKEETMRRKLDWLINQLAIRDQNHARWGIVTCSVTPQKDLVLGLRDTAKVLSLAKNGWLILPIGTLKPLTIACGLLVE